MSNAFERFRNAAVAVSLAISLWGGVAHAAGGEGAAAAARFADADRRDREGEAMATANQEIAAAGAARVAVEASRPRGFSTTAVLDAGLALAARVRASEAFLPATLAVLLAAGIALGLAAARCAPIALRASARVRAFPGRLGTQGTRRAATPRRAPQSAVAGAVAPDENVWGKILRLSASGLSGDEIARALGASPSDVDLVIGLQRRRVEIAGALAKAADAN